jgi:His-Xaa-Ser system protein HxsD
MEIRSLEKSCHSEWVVRNALYWLSAVTRWQLDETDNQWIIRLEEPSTDAVFELERLLNDYILREKVMHRTAGLRDAIAVSVLEGIQGRLSS